jgi:hypothetical protein
MNAWYGLSEWFTPIHKQNWKTSAIRNLLLFLNRFFNREIFVNLKESIFFAQALNLFGQSSTKIQLCFIKRLQISHMARIVLIIDQNPSLNCRCSVSWPIWSLPCYPSQPVPQRSCLPCLSCTIVPSTINCPAFSSPARLSYLTMPCPAQSSLSPTS